MDSPLITTLIDIYLFYWQYDLLRRLNRKQHRFFGRCSNKMIFAWNDSKENLIAFLNQRNLTHSSHPDIRLTVSMGYRVQFLDAEISHLQGMLQTRVYHHPTFEPLCLTLSVGNENLSISCIIITCCSLSCRSLLF